MTIAWVFPGQGSQAVGMGTDLIDNAIAKEKFAKAEQILGWSVVERCQSNERSYLRPFILNPVSMSLKAF
jgi:[acyl-carrier-protein] S-malonyltransferase